jgi:hypothetical protein
VRHVDGGDVLWFISLDVSSPLNAAVGRLAAAWSETTVDAPSPICVRSARTGSRGGPRLAEHPGGPMSNLPADHNTPDEVEADTAPEPSVAPVMTDPPVHPLDAGPTPDADPSAGAEEAVAPSASDERSARGAPVDAALGVIRLGVGAALVVAPAWAGRIWVGPGADGPGSRVFARALGARDVALGLRILQGWRTGEPVRHWVAAGFAADAADVVATLIASRDLTLTRRAAMPLIAGAVGAAGVWSDRRTG